jgi:beta-glucanase (GH16 family)
MKKTTLKTIALFGFAILSLSSFAQDAYVYTPPTTPPPYDPVGVKPGYTLQFNDEFNGPTLSQWNGSTGTWAFSASSIGDAYYDGTLHDISFVSSDISGGTAIKVDVEAISPTMQNGQTYYHRSLMFQTHRTFKYGYYEIRMKQTTGMGIWPAFWLYGNTPTICAVDSPGHYSEIDILEDFPTAREARMKTENTHVWEFNYQYPGCTGAFYLGLNEIDLSTTDNASRYYTGSQDLKDAYHLYGLKFTPDSIIWYMDNVPFRYIYKGEYPDATNTFARMLSMWITLDMAITSPNYTISGINSTDYTDHVTPGSIIGSMYVDYVRYYKQNPVISLYPVGNCPALGSNVSLTASTGISTDTYVWSAGSNCTLIGSATANPATFKVNALPATVQVTATDIDGNHSTNTYTIAHINSAFTAGAPYCTGSSINVSASCPTLPSTTASEWQLYNAVGGHFSGSSLETEYGNSGTTFNKYSLIQGNQYSIIHGVWDACTPWSYTEQVFTANLSAFTYTPLVCTSTGQQTTATASGSSGGTYQWNLYSCDATGYISNWTTLSPTPAYGNTITLSNLQPGQYYMLYMGIYGGSCVNSWTATGQLIYAPADNLDPYFACTNNSVFGNPNERAISGVCTSAPVSTYALFTSDVSGDLGTQYTSWVYSQSASFNPTTINSGAYLLLVHGTYSSCAGWVWLGRLIWNPAYNSNPNPYLSNTGVDSPIKDSTDGVSPGIHFTQTQEDALQESVLHPVVFDNTTPGHAIQINLAPNPAADECMVVLSEQIDQGTMQVMDMDGKIIRTTELNGSISYNLNLSGISEGVYLVKIISNKKTGFAKLIHMTGK